jgi:fructose-1,6-bisphosphatase II
VLKRPRHEQLIAAVRATGARIKLFADGDVAASIAAATEGTGTELVLTVGGTPEGSSPPAR